MIHLQRLQNDKVTTLLVTWRAKVLD